MAFSLTHDPFRYRRRLPHIQNAFCYFVSFHCQGDLTLPEETRTLVLETILKEAERTITLYAATIMPNHAHMLFSIRPLQPEPVLYRILQTIKRISAWKVNRELGRAGGLWQPESFDRMLRTNRDEFERYFFRRCRQSCFHCVLRNIAGTGILIASCRVSARRNSCCVEASCERRNRGSVGPKSSVRHRT